MTDLPAPVEPALPSPAPNRIKRWIYAIAAVAFFANGMLNQYFFWNREITPLDFFFGFFSLFLVFWWYRIDSRQRGFRPPRGLSLVIVLLTIVGLPYYLFKTRGFARGLLATGLFLGVIIANAVLVFAGASATYYLFQA